MRFLITALGLLIAVLAFGCANPAANKPQASVGKAAPDAGSPAPAGAETLIIAPENSKVEFVAAKVTRSHNGHFEQFTGSIDLAGSSADQSRVTIDIETGSVMTDEDQLTGHLKTADFFDVAKFPKATFVSTKIEPRRDKADANTYDVTGNFDLHGIKKSITFPANIQIGPDRVAVNAEFAINRKDFGIVYAGKADNLIRDGVVIRLTLNVPRKKS